MLSKSLFEEKKVIIIKRATDKFVKKGPGRPIFKFNQRAEALSALEDIDFIIEKPILLKEI